MKDPKYFIVIDDDAINNKICRTVIEKIYLNSDVKTFTDPVLGFEYIVSEYSKADIDNNAILFLDINMPVMDAWDFLNLFDRLDAHLRSRITIFILSSSVNKVDMERAMSNRNVSYYLIKPLTKESIKLISNLVVKKMQSHPEATAKLIEGMSASVRKAQEEEELQLKKIAEEREAKMSVIRMKNDLVNTVIQDLEKQMNATLFELEKKYKETGLLIEPVTVNHSAFDRKKGGKLQLSIHFFEFDNGTNVQL